jgi:hypothetical protein
MTIAWNANYIETMPFSDTCFQIALSTASEQNITVPGSPTEQYQAYFEYACNANIYVSRNVPPEYPTPGATGSQSYCEFKPKKRYVSGGDIIYFITPDDTAYCGVSLRKLQTM